MTHETRSCCSPCTTHIGYTRGPPQSRRRGMRSHARLAGLLPCIPGLTCHRRGLLLQAGGQRSCRLPGPQRAACLRAPDVDLVLAIGNSNLPGVTLDCCKLAKTHLSNWVDDCEPGWVQRQSQQQTRPEGEAEEHDPCDHWRQQCRSFAIRRMRPHLPYFCRHTRSPVTHRSHSAAYTDILHDDRGAVIRRCHCTADCGVQSAPTACE